MTDLNSHKPGQSLASITYIGASALVLYYALRGGSYDIVPRQEEALVLSWGLAFGLAFGIFALRRPTLPQGLTFAGFLLLAVLAVVALSWTESDERTVAELARIVHYLALLVLGYFVIDTKNWIAAVGGLLTGAVAVCAIAVANRIDPNLFGTDHVQQVFHITRLSYPLNYWNAVGAWAAVTLTGVLGVGSHVRSLAARCAANAAIPVCALAAYLTYSRAAAGGVVIGVVAVVILSQHRWTTVVHVIGAAAGAALAIASARGHPDIALAKGAEGGQVVALALVAGMGVAACAPLLSSFVRSDGVRLPRRFAHSVATIAVLGVAVLIPTVGIDSAQGAWNDFRRGDPTVQSADPAARLASLRGRRYELWSSAWRAFKNEPVHGIGPGSYEFWWSRTASTAGFERDAHSLYLETLAEFGVPGFLALLAAVVGLIWSAFRFRAELKSPAEKGVAGAAMASFLVYMVHAGVDWMWESTAVSVLGLGLIATLALSDPTERSRVTRRSVRLAVAALALAGSMVQLPGLVSTSELRQSRTSAARDRLDEADRQAGDAIAAQPWAATPYMQRALVREASDQLAAAGRDLHEATRREPTNWRPWFLLARVEAERGRSRPALRAYRQAQLLRPESPFLPRKG